MIDERESVVYFYGKLAGGTRRDAIRVARAAGWRVAETLSSAVSLVVLGEGAELAQTRRALAAEFDERSDLAFERGTLRIVSESEFAALLSGDSATPSRGRGATPAAVAGVVGASVGTVRRWLRRGFLRPIDPSSRFPLLSPHEIQVARRLAFLCSGALSEEQVERQIVAFGQGADSRDAFESSALSDAAGYDAAAYPLFAEEEFEPQSSSRGEADSVDWGAVILSLTLSTDGRELLRYRGDQPEGGAPVDSRGQLFFDFAAYPPDGAIGRPEGFEKLSAEEEQLALAERLSGWNAQTTAETGVPAFLELFSDASADDAIDSARAAASSSSSESRPEEGAVETGASRQARLCAQAWLYEREGYWEEAARTYRLAGLAGGADPGVDLCLGRTLCLLGDYSAARERFCSALELDPNFNDARLELGRVYVALHEYEDALSAFRAARDARPTDPAPRVELGKLMLRFGDRRGAEEEFRRAAERIEDPRFASDVAALVASLDSET